MNVLSLVAACGAGVVSTACAFATLAPTELPPTPEHTAMVTDAATAHPDALMAEGGACETVEAFGGPRTEFRPRSVVGILRAQRKSRTTCCGVGGPLVKDVELVVGLVSYPCFDWWSVVVAGEVARFSMSESGPEVVTWGGRSDTLAGRAARGWFDSFAAAQEIESDNGGLRGTTRVTDDGTAACSRVGESYGCRFEVAPAAE